MKFPYLLAAIAMTSSANAAVTVQKDVSIGMDAAIVEAFNEVASKQAIDDTGILQLDRVKDAVSSVKLNGENFEITFDENKINSVLRDSGIACWSGLSEPVLVWMTDVSSDESSIISADSTSTVMKSLIDDANASQYNLLFPLMDLDDIQNVNEQTILSHSDKILAKASSRYGVKFFISAALEKNEDVQQVTFKWNVFDDQGKILGNGENTGTTEEISKAATKEIAKVLMNNTIESQTDQNSTVIPLTSADEQQNASDVAQEEDLSLGPVKGGVRVLFTGIDNVADYLAISKTLVMYGYESDVNVLAYQDSGVVFMIPTGSSPLILDGTLSHAGEFTKIAPWTYKYNKSHGSVVSSDTQTGTVSKRTEQIITTDIDKYNGQAYTTSTVQRTTEITQEEVPVAKSNVTLTDDLEYSDKRKGSLGN